MSKKDCQNCSHEKLLSEYTEFLKRKKPDLVWEDKEDMSKRLKTTKDLLRDNGIIVVAKDCQNWSHEKLLDEYKELLNRQKTGPVCENKDVVEKRLKIVKDLLKDRGVIIATIDDYELYILGLFLGIYS